MCIRLFSLFKLSSSTLGQLFVYVLDTSPSYDPNLLLETEQNNHTALLAGTTELFTEKGRGLLVPAIRKTPRCMRWHS